MPNKSPLQIEFERQLKEFENKWQDPMEKKYGDGFKLFCSFCQGEWRGQIKDFIVSCQQEWMKKVTEMIEGMKKNNSCSHDQDGACYVKYGNICTESYNLAISDILSALNKAI